MLINNLGRVTQKWGSFLHLRIDSNFLILKEYFSTLVTCYNLKKCIEDEEVISAASMCFAQPSHFS